jgi:endonuclease YncB( thermonuclease family)
MRRRFLLFFLLFFALSAPACADDDISGFAFVRNDGTLQISGYAVRLYGIYIPPTDNTCYPFMRPVPCGSRASLALDFRISGNFVHCSQKATNQDGSVIADCSVDDQDLSEWMLQKGWALALPDAPFEYAAMERIAESKGLGIWGTAVDNSRGRRR